MKFVYVNTQPLSDLPGDTMTLTEFVDSLCQATAHKSENIFVVAGNPSQLQTVAQAVAQGSDVLIVWAVPERFHGQVRSLIDRGELQAFGVVSLPTNKQELYRAMAITLARKPRKNGRVSSEEVTVTEEAGGGRALAEQGVGAIPPQPEPPTPVLPEPPVFTPPEPPTPQPISGTAPPPAFLEPEAPSPGGVIRVIRPPRATVREARVGAGVVTLLISPPGVHAVDVYVSPPSAEYPPETPALTLTGTAEVQFGVPGEPGTLVKLWVGVDGEPPLPLAEPVRVPRPPVAVRAKPKRLEVLPSAKVLANTPLTVVWHIAVSAPVVVTGYLSIGGGTYPATATISPPEGKLEWVLANGLPVGKHKGEVALATPVTAKAGLVITAVGLAGESELRQQPYGTVAVTGDAILHAARALRAKGVKVGVCNCTEWDIPDEPPTHPSEGLVLVLAHPGDVPSPPPTLATVYTTAYQPPQRALLEAVMLWGAPVIVSTPSGKPWGTEPDGVRVVQFDPAKPRPFLADVLR